MRNFPIGTFKLIFPRLAWEFSVQSDSGYAYLDGTSMAAPHVSGVAALVWSAIPNLTNTEVRDALIATAEDLGTPGRDDMYGAGLVQANKALTYLYDTPFPTLYPTSIETPTDYPTAQTSEAPTTKPLTKKPTIKSKSSKLPKLPK